MIAKAYFDCTSSPSSIGDRRKADRPNGILISNTIESGNGIHMAEDRIKEYITKQFPSARGRDLSNDEEEFDISVDDDELVPENFQTIARLASFVSEKQNASA